MRKGVSTIFHMSMYLTNPKLYIQEWFEKNLKPHIDSALLVLVDQHSMVDQLHRQDIIINNFESQLRTKINQLELCIENEKNKKKIAYYERLVRNKLNNGKKPRLLPPGMLFGIMWGTIYGCQALYLLIHSIIGKVPNIWFVTTCLLNMTWLVVVAMWYYSSGKKKWYAFLPWVKDQTDTSRFKKYECSGIFLVFPCCFCCCTQYELRGIFFQFFALS